MKAHTLILVFILSLFAVKVAGQCTAAISGGTSPVCYNTSPGSFTATGGGDTPYTYLWYLNGVATSTTTQTYDPGNLIANSTVYCAITCNGASTENSNSITITVNPVTIAGSVTGGSAICSGDNSGILTLSGYTGTVVRWESSPDGSSWSPISHTSDTYTSGALTSITYFRAVVQSGVCPAANSGSTIVTVDAPPAGGTVSPAQTICNNTTPLPISVTGYSGVIVRWESCDQSNFDTPVPIAVTTPTLTLGVHSDDTWYRVVVKSGSCSSVTSNEIRIRVHGALAAPISGGTTPVCYNASPGVITVSPTGGDGVYSYQWWNTTTGSISGATSATYTPGNLTANTGFYCVINSSCGTITSSTRSIVVNTQLSLSGASQNVQICSGSAATINLTGLLSSTTSTISYSINGIARAPVSGVLSSGTGTASFLTGSLAAVDNGKTLLITGVTNQATGCSATFTQGTTLIVNSATVPTLTGILSPCINSTGNVYTTEPGMNAGSYNWTFSGGGSFTGGGANDNTITVNWTTAGTHNIGVNYTNSSGCSAASSTVKSITVNPLPIPTITSGPASVCIGSSGNIYTTQAGMPTYYWSVSAGGTITSGGSGNFIVVTWNTSGAQSVSVNYTNPAGCTAISSTSYPITVNPLPVPAISGPLTVRETSTGNIYSTDTGMNSYVWSITPGGTITAGGTSISNSVTVTWNSAGAQSVSVRYTNASSCTAASATLIPVTVNPLPSVSNVQISGTQAIGYTLSGTYNWDNGGAGLDISTYRWLKNGTTLIGAGSNTYLVQPSDLKGTITFEVTPVTSSGTPNSGTVLTSSATGPVEDLSEIPVADEVCIDGSRSAGRTLKGKYRYTHSKPEGASTYKWFINGVQIPSATGTQYTLLPGDIDNNEDITFEVTPVSSNIIPVIGSAGVSKPLARIILPKVEYSVSEKDVVLSKNAPGGIFYGSGVSDSIFSPKIAGSDNSPYTIGYILSIEKSNYTCSQLTSVVVSVLPNIASFNGFNPVYCFDNGPDVITVAGVPAGATDLKFTITNPAGLISQSGLTATIDPGMMDPGDNIDRIFFSYNNSGVFFEISESFVIVKVEQATISNLNPGDTICNSRAPFELYHSPLGGVFSSPVVIGTKLDPSLLNPTGNTFVNYAFTDTLSGCSSSVLVPIVINPAPVLSFTVADYCIENEKDLTQFINTSTSVDPVKEWVWKFTQSNGDIGGSNLENPGYLFKTGGLSRVELTETTTKNCYATRQETFNLGSKPNANFYWRDDCLGSNEGFLTIRDTTSGTSAIISREWTIFNTPVNENTNVIKYPKTTEGYVPVKLVVKTNYKNCDAEITKNIYIRKNISLATDDYFEDFESGNSGGWVKNDEATQLWSFGTPNRPVIDDASSPSHAWYTSYSLTGQKKDSASVVSPCFDFSSIQRPMFRMQMRTKFDKNADGAVLEYKAGDRMKWQPVGSLDDGISWFNSPSIRFPGGNQTGWTTDDAADTLWKSVANTLTELAGKKDVKFRIKYGTDGYASDNDGIAFDDIYIGERGRKVLLEHFTNTGSNTSTEATKFVDDFLKRRVNDVINIQYHTNFPGSDPFYTSNPGDASARIFSYGLSRVPYSLIDGGFSKAAFASLADYKTTKLDTNDLSRRSLMDSRFTISVTPVISGGVLTVNSSVTAVEGITSDNMVLYLVVTEKKNNSQTGPLKDKNFLNVFRKFIPDAGGIELRRTWAKDETDNIPAQTWVIENITNFSDIEVIAFIQNSQTKEVYQTESEILTTGKSATDKSIQDKSAIGLEDKSLSATITFGLYPNPAEGRLTIEFSSPLETDADIRIYDLQGAVKSTFKVASGESSLFIDDLGLRAGIYLVRITAGGTDLGFRKLIVSGD